jgi:tetratricopeptide (TPR) repeat protein
MTSKSLVLASALTALAFGAAGSASAACQFQKIVDVPVTMDGLRPQVSAKVNGQDATFMVDTGAFFSDVTDAAAAKFAMRPSAAPFGLEVRSAGGATRDARAVVAQDFSFAGAQFHNIEFLLGGRLGGDLAGVIGENIMGPFDVEYDLGNGVIRFFKADGGCYNQNLAYWSAGMALSRITIEQQGRFIQTAIAKAEVDGHTIHVKFDSGAQLSTLSRAAAARAGIQMSSEGVRAAGVTYGVYGKGQETYLAPFASFKIGDEEIKNTQLRMADIALGDSDMLLGADFFLSHRILISNTQKKIYFTYNGGPVFRLGGAARQVAQGSNVPAATSPGTPASAPGAAAAGGDGLKSAAEFQRRGQANASRREYVAAIDDFSKAIELEPSNGAHYHARAMARLANRQPVLAMADLDQALKYNPSDVPALITRGRLYLQARDPGRATSDFEAALKLDPQSTTLPTEIGYAYARAGLFEPALQQLDSWVATHPRDDALPQVLNARCWTRAVWGKELDRALADCDAALKADKISGVMDSRGLVLLRLGRLDDAIAQYSAAIRLQPRLAPALYGRGLAELKKGAKAEGAADIEAAKAIAPELPAEYRRFGLAPEEAPGAAKS